jgi:hypothetical protein
LYGQDVTFDKNIFLHIGDHRIHLSRIDSRLGAQMISHKLADDLLIMTEVVKEGKTTVRVTVFTFCSFC